jgi:hypothetical protein
MEISSKVRLLDQFLILQVGRFGMIPGKLYGGKLEALQ